MCALFTDFRRRFIALMSFSFRAFEPSTCMMILQQKHFKPISKGESRQIVSGVTVLLFGNHCRNRVFCLANFCLANNTCIGAIM